MVCDNCKKGKSNVKTYSFKYGKKIKEVTHDYYSAKQTVSTYSLRQESANICDICIDEKIISKAVQGGIHIIGPVIMFIVALGVIAPYFSGDGSAINWVIGLTIFVIATQLVKSFIPGRYITKQSIGEQIAYDVKVPYPKAKGVEFFGDSENDDTWYFTLRGSFGIIAVIIWLPFHLIYTLIRKISDVFKITDLIFGTPLQMVLNRLRSSSPLSTKRTSAARDLKEINLTDTDIPVLLIFFRNVENTDSGLAVFISGYSKGSIAR